MDQSLPCSRGRHDSCGGEFAFGVAQWLMRHECACSCHLDQLEVLDPRYAVWGASSPRLTLVARS